MLTKPKLSHWARRPCCGPYQVLSVLAKSLNKCGYFDREAADHDPKREIDFYRDNQLALDIHQM